MSQILIVFPAVNAAEEKEKAGLKFDENVLLVSNPIFFFLISVAPDPPENCTVINKSSETFHLQCIPGNCNK